MSIIIRHGDRTIECKSLLRAATDVVNLVNPRPMVIGSDIEPIVVWKPLPLSSDALKYGVEAGRIPKGAVAHYQPMYIIGAVALLLDSVHVWEVVPDAHMPAKTPTNDQEHGLGIIEKFQVRRLDGSSGPGGKHEHCDFFVLDWQHDPYAVQAALAYATACESHYPELAATMRRRAARALKTSKGK